MKLKQVKEILEADVVVGEDSLDMQVAFACGSDLMSDVLTFLHRGALLLTGLTNAQVVRTAEMAEIVCICFVRTKQPQAQTIKLAKEKGVVLMSTSFTMYESCGRLYKNNLPACDICT